MVLSLEPVDIGSWYPVSDIRDACNRGGGTLRLRWRIA